ncbi:hypothetical protein LINPERHAP1_LOCUS21525, partial [Linum perenne]
ILTVDIFCSASLLLSSIDARLKKTLQSSIRRQRSSAALQSGHRAAADEGAEKLLPSPSR